MTYLIKPKGFNEKIDFKLPINYKQEWSHLFKPDNAYKKVKLGARLLKNVFVNHYGLVIKNGVLVKGCAPNIGHTKYEDNNFYFKHWKKATEQWLVAKFGNSIASKRLDDHKTYLVIHSPWFSYYFWITECIPRLLMVKEHLHELTLIYPENWKKFSFVNETLDLFPELEREVIPSDVHLFVKNLVMPEVKPWTPMFIPEMIYETKTLLEKQVISSGLESDTPKKIYISRKKAARRKFLSETDMEKFLNEFGFETITMEDFSFYDQIRFMMNAKVVCGITGAGHVNSMFMKEGAHFFDFTNVGYKKSKIYKFHYHKLCNIVGVNYWVQFFDFEEKPDISKFSQQPLIPDFDLLGDNLNSIMK